MSRDSANELFYPLFDAVEHALWIVDEQLDPRALPAVREGIAVVCNRYEVAAAFAAAGWRASFSDFDLDPLPDNGLDAIFFRLAKEKAAVHHIINRAAEKLAPGGKLYLAGEKSQGIKSYAKKAAQRLGSRAEVKKLGSLYLARIEAGTAPGEPLDDREYRQLRQAVCDGELCFLSKPGLYGWDKVDPGSRLLVEQLEGELAGQCIESVLDIGCGYGYLSLWAHRLFAPKHLVASDNNAAALLACEANFTASGVTAGKVVAADAAAGIPGRFDLVLCNPPFHKGFAVEGEMGRHFLAAAAAHLNPGGVALFVVNAFIPLQRLGGEYFATVREVANNGRFKVIAFGQGSGR